MGLNDQFFKNLHGKYGDIAAFHLMPGVVNLSVADPALASEVMKKCATRPPETVRMCWFCEKLGLYESVFPYELPIFMQPYISTK